MSGALARWAFVPAVALLAAGAAGSLLILIYGAAPLEVWGLLLEGTWGNPYGLGQVLYKATPLALTGLSVAVALRAGLFNIGAEGQLVVGGLAIGIVGPWLGGLPAPVAMGAGAAAGALGGALWGAIAGLLRARRGAHEVISTIMLNFIAHAVAVWAGGHLFVKESLHTAPIAEAARIPRLEALLPALRGSAANLSLLLSLAAGAAVWFLLFRTATGARLRAVGLAPGAAAATGTSVAGVQIQAMCLSGALAGLAAVSFVQGYKGYYEDGLAGGVGFMGIAVALLGRNHPVGVLVAALLFGTLSQGGLAINAQVPKELVDVLLAVIILVVATAGALSLREARRRGEAR